MARWVETTWWRYSFEEEVTTESSDSNRWSKGIWKSSYWKIKTDSLEQKLEHLTDYCDEHQYEVKSIMPINRAQSYEYGQMDTNFGGTAGAGWGLGQGWGITMTDGFVALLQRVEDVSQEEFDKRMAERKEKKRISGAEKLAKEELYKLQSDLKSFTGEFELASGYINSEIVIEKGLLGSKYHINNKQFKREKDALAFQAKCTQDIAKYKSEIDAINIKIEAETTKIKSLEVELAAVK